MVYSIIFQYARRLIDEVKMLERVRIKTSQDQNVETDRILFTFIYNL